MFVVWAEPWKTEAAIDAKLSVVGLHSKEFVIRGIHCKHYGWETIDEVNCRGERISPILLGHRGVC